MTNEGIGEMGRLHAMERVYACARVKSYIQKRVHIAQARDPSAL